MQKPLKIWTSNAGYKAAAAAIILALGIITAVWFAIIKLNQYLYPEPRFYSDVKNLDIKTYSSSGQVKAVEKGGLTITVGQVVTGKQGNELKYFEKTVTYNSETKIFQRIAEGSADFAAALQEDITVGKDITVYTKTNPYENAGFLADRIEIN